MHSLDGYMYFVDDAELVASLRRAFWIFDEEATGFIDIRNQRRLVSELLQMNVSSEALLRVSQSVRRSSGDAEADLCALEEERLYLRLLGTLDGEDLLRNH